ncbi:MAG: type IV pilus assembly protein PilM [Patescibacteria group bacterium]
MFEFLTRRVLNPPAFGLDISDLTLKFVGLGRQGREHSLRYFGEMPIPPGVVMDGEIKKEDDLIAVLIGGLRTAAGKIMRERFVVASLPEEKSFVRVIELPGIKPEDVGHAVRWELEGVVPLSFKDITFDYQLLMRLAGSDDHRDVLITAFPRKIVESYHRVLAAAGLVPLALELESQAISRAIIAPELLSRPQIIIDSGALRTSFIIFAGGSLIFTKSISVGGHDFETAIAKSLGLSEAEARQVKIAAGLSKIYRSGQVFQALEPQLRALTAELERELWFYRDHPAKRHRSLGDIERIILCGGDANLIGLDKYIATTIKKPTVLGNPFANVKLESGAIPPIPRNEALKYTTALGLALRAAQE